MHSLVILMNIRIRKRNASAGSATLRVWIPNQVWDDEEGRKAVVRRDHRPRLS
jgi:hypothetical protein